MDLSKQNILFFPRTMGLGGTEKVVLQICEIFKPLVNKIIVCSCGGENVKYLDTMGIRHYMIPDIESKSPVVMLKTAGAIRRIVRNENITVIHTHHRMAAFYAAVLKLYRKCICINTCHNTFYNKKLLTKFSYRHVNLIACGEMVKRNLTEYFDIRSDRITVIRNAVKSFDGRITREPVIEEMKKNNCFIVGNIGRLSEQKGMEYYIKAIPSIVNKHPDTRFLVIGDGEDKEKLITLAGQLNVNDYVFFMGYRSDIQNIMAQIDLVVLSSLWEGLPITPIEAFSVGKTVVATAVDGTVEIVQDKFNGLLIEPGNSEQIAENIIWVAEHTDERKKLEIASIKSYEEKFTFEFFSNNYIDYFKQLKKQA